MHKNSKVSELTEIQTMSYVLRSIAERKSEEEIAERLDGNIILVKTWIDALKQIAFVRTNYFDELVITPDGRNYLKIFESDQLLSVRSQYLRHSQFLLF